VKRLELVLIFLFIALSMGIILSGCSHQIQLKDNYVETNRNLFQSSSMKTKRINLIMGLSLKDYRLTRPVYNWAAGSLAPDHITFEIGKSYSKELSSLCGLLFLSVTELDSLKRAKSKSKGSFDFIIVPEIIGAEIFFPSIRFGNIRTEITSKYSFYDSGGSLIDQITVIGRGEKRSGYSNKNYQIAVELAIQDLIMKSYKILSGMEE